MGRVWRKLREWFVKPPTHSPLEARGDTAEMIRDFMAANGYDVVTYAPAVVGPLGGESARIIVSQVTVTGHVQYLTILVYARGLYAVVND